MNNNEDKIICPITSETSTCTFKERKEESYNCPHMDKCGSYKTATGEAVQRYICASSFRTFTKYTNDKSKAYMQNRELPVDKIIKDYEQMPYSIELLSKKYDLSMSTIRTILKKAKTSKTEIKSEQKLTKTYDNPLLPEEMYGESIKYRNFFNRFRNKHVWRSYCELHLCTFWGCPYLKSYPIMLLEGGKKVKLYFCSRKKTTFKKSDNEALSKFKKIVRSEKDDSDMDRLLSR